MTCPRCRGRMFLERDLEFSGGLHDLVCVNCGHVVYGRALGEDQLEADRLRQRTGAGRRYGSVNGVKL